MIRPLVASLFLLAFPLVALACNQDAEVAGPPDSAPSAPTATASSSPVADAAVPGSDARPPEDGGADTAKAVCNDLRNIASDVPETLEASDPPEMTGGSFEDGTYVLVRTTVYTGTGGMSGPTGKTMRMTIRKSGTQYDSVFDGLARSAVVSIRGAEMMTTTVCPGSSTMTLGFTATTDSLTVRFAEGASTRVYVYEKR